MMKRLYNLTLTMLLAAGLVVSAGAKAQEPVFGQAELDQMLAPVALYPDTVLSHVLIAATYPLEVVQAARWSRDNPGLRGEQAVYAVEHMGWDPSVKALVAFPDLLQRMDQDLDWTQALGDAFLLQEEQLLDTVQYLREEAYAQGHLRSNEYVRVVREPQYIYIEPATPRVVYVPYYDPRVVYVNWRWPAYPPRYWHHPPGFRAGVSFHWGIGFSIAPAHFYFSSFHWPRRHVVSVHHHHHHHHRGYKPPKRKFHSGREVARHDGAGRWRHDPQHRRGVSYREGVDERRFTRSPSEAAQARTAARTAQSRPAERDRAAANTVRRSADTLNTSDTRGGRRDASVARSRQNAGGGVANRDRNRSSAAAAQRRDAPVNRPAVQRSGASRSDQARNRAAASAPRVESMRGRSRSAGASAPNRAAARAEPEQSRSATVRPDVNTRPAAPARSQSSGAVNRAAGNPRSAAARQSGNEQRSAPARPPASARRDAAPQRSAPVQRSTPARPAASVQQPAPAQRSAPQRQSQTRNAAPAQRDASAQRREGGNRDGNGRGRGGSRRD